MPVLRLIAVALPICLMICSCGRPRVPVLFLFEKSKGLEVGAPVVYKDIPVGQVTGVELGESGKVNVSARISWETYQKMNKPCTALVEQNEYGKSKVEKCVVIYMADGVEQVSEPITRIEGCDSRPELLLWLTTHKAKAFLSEHEEELEAIKQSARDAADWVQEFAESEDVKEFTNKLNNFAKETGEKATETYEELSRQWPVVSERFEEIYKRLEELGRSEEAQRLRESIRQLFSPVPTPTPETKGAGQEI
ncbi:MAG: MlaD family protein [bacterium]